MTKSENVLTKIESIPSWVHLKSGNAPTYIGTDHSTKNDFSLLVS
jgi:hypothetical protein